MQCKNVHMVKTDVMVQMMKFRLDIRKTPFFETINPEKLIKRIFYLSNPPNAPSTSKFSLKRRFNSKTVELFPTAGYLTPR
jgi:hypothetical protein